MRFYLIPNSKQSTIEENLCLKTKEEVVAKEGLIPTNSFVKAAFKAAADVTIFIFLSKVTSKVTFDNKNFQSK